MITQLKSYEDIRKSRNKLRIAVDAFLRRKGWRRLTSTPGGYALWNKKVSWKDAKNSRVTKEISTTKETALAIQRFLDDVSSKRRKKSR